MLSAGDGVGLASVCGVIIAAIIAIMKRSNNGHDIEKVDMTFCNERSKAILNHLKTDLTYIKESVDRLTIKVERLGK